MPLLLKDIYRPRDLRVAASSDRANEQFTTLQKDS